MSNKDYKQIILDGLLKNIIIVMQRILLLIEGLILKPKEVYKIMTETMQTYWKARN